MKRGRLALFHEPAAGIPLPRKERDVESIRQVATPAAVLAYCDAGHTNSEAAVRFGVHERTIRKWRVKARSAGSYCQKEAESAIVPAQIGETDNRVQLHIPDEWIARDGQLWKCPRCAELMPPVPGTTGANWNARGCYLHQVEPALDEPDPEPGPPAASVNDPAPAPELAPLDPARPVDPLWISCGQELNVPLLQLLFGIIVVWIVVAMGMG